MKKCINLISALLLSVSLWAQEVPEEFKKQLGVVVNSSFPMTKYLVENDATKVSAEAEKVKKSLSAVDMMLLKGQAHMVWMESRKELDETLAILAESDNLKEQREAFARFNEALYASLKAHGVTDVDTLYYQYCPMALDNQGAYWLSDSKEIFNPYFGEMMLRCGNTKEVIVE